MTHGIGVFDGIHKLELQGVVKDYIKIKYAGSDILYVPVTQLDLVSKYIGPREDAHVKLNRLHSTEWQKTRQRVKKAVDEMADELIALYAKRMSVKGYAFSPDDEMQRDFEEHFEYQETDDQLRCIREIKEDMEKPVPMERLLCGDVGFGKTEVALRAAFKLRAGRQTVRNPLPDDHPRLAALPDDHRPDGQLPGDDRAALPLPLPEGSRRRLWRSWSGGSSTSSSAPTGSSAKTSTLRTSASRLSIEEQRFGVAHKERFKEMLASVDMLTPVGYPDPPGR